MASLELKRSLFFLANVFVLRTSRLPVCTVPVSTLDLLQQLTEMVTPLHIFLDVCQQNATEVEGVEKKVA